MHTCRNCGVNYECEAVASGDGCSDADLCADCDLGGADTE